MVKKMLMKKYAFVMHLCLTNVMGADSDENMDNNNADETEHVLLVLVLLVTWYFTDLEMNLLWHELP